jgi:hypothetical protein
MENKNAKPGRKVFLGRLLGEMFFHSFWVYLYMAIQEQYFVLVVGSENIHYLTAGHTNFTTFDFQDGSITSSV